MISIYFDSLPFWFVSLTNISYFILLKYPWSSHDHPIEGFIYVLQFFKYLCISKSMFYKGFVGINDFKNSKGDEL